MQYSIVLILNMFEQFLCMIKMFAAVCRNPETSADCVASLHLKTPVNAQVP
jgi:hypothetical protein